MAMLHTKQQKGYQPLCCLHSQAAVQAAGLSVSQCQSLLSAHPSLAIREKMPGEFHPRLLHKWVRGAVFVVYSLNLEKAPFFSWTLPIPRDSSCSPALNPARNTQRWRHGQMKGKLLGHFETAFVCTTREEQPKGRALARTRNSSYLDAFLPRCTGQRGGQCPLSNPSPPSLQTVQIQPHHAVSSVFSKVKPHCRQKAFHTVAEQ